MPKIVLLIPGVHRQMLKCGKFLQIEDVVIESILINMVNVERTSVVRAVIESPNFLVECSNSPHPMTNSWPVVLSKMGTLGLWVSPKSDPIELNGFDHVSSMSPYRRESSLLHPISLTQIG